MPWEPFSRPQPQYWIKFLDPWVPGKKKQHKHKLFGPDFPRTFLTLTPGCPGVQKFIPITGTAEKCTLFRDFQKALETTTAMKRRKILRKICSNRAVSSLSLRGRCISRSLHDAAKVVISRLLTRNCCGLAFVVSVIFASQRWPGGQVVVSRSLPLRDLGGSNWDTRKS